MDPFNSFVGRWMAVPKSVLVRVNSTTLGFHLQQSRSVWVLSFIRDTNIDARGSIPPGCNDRAIPQILDSLGLGQEAAGGLESPSGEMG